MPEPESHAALRRDLAHQGRALRQHIPGVYRGYSELAKATMAPGALSVRVKELIALTVAVVQQCDGCIAAHASGAARAGATADEVAEALGVAIMMMGGPGTVYAARAMTAFTEFSTPPPESGHP
jgi:AhpD family alkylhydroperoxidase